MILRHVSHLSCLTITLLTLGSVSAIQPCDPQTACMLPSGIWMVFSGSTPLPGVGTVENEDIASFDSDTGTWRLVLDGSDLGLAAMTVDAMAVTLSGDILLSFTVGGNIPGLSGGPEGAWVDDSDIVRFAPDSLGANTSGQFYFEFDGSDVELATEGEDLDAIQIHPDGRLIFSTLASMSAGGFVGTEKDLWLFNASNLGADTLGSFELLFRASDVGLSGSASENVDALTLTPSGSLLLSTGGTYGVPGLQGSNQDVFEFVPTQWGVPTVGTYQLFLELGTLGVDPSKNLTALEVLEAVLPPDFPDVQFTVSPVDGPAPLSVHCIAFRADGLPLPGGTYTWTIDGQQVTGPMETHGTLTQELTESGAHVITLMITLAGLTAPVSCTSAETGTLEGRAVVWPRISGRVLDAEGNGLAGITVLSLVESISTVTRSDGTYDLFFPFGWTGFIRPEQPNYVFSPEFRYFDPLQSSIYHQDFLAFPREDSVVSGHVRDFQGQPMAGVPLLFHGSGASAGSDHELTTDSNGHYYLSLTPGWTGSIETDGNHRLDPPNAGELTFNDPAVQRDFTAYRNYFVALNGTDALGAGRLESPFQSIQKAANEARPGDTINIREGTYDLQTNPAYHLSVIHFAHSGRVDEPITIQAYPGELITLTTAASKGVFDFSDTWGHNTAGFGHYVFRNLRITGGRYGWIIRPPVPTAWQAGVDPLPLLWESQIHDVLIEDCEVDGNGTVEAGLYVRYGGVRNLTMRRCNFHHTIGTEGTVDIGEWRDTDPAHIVPRSASHNLLFEDCDFHHAVHQQANGIVTQPCVFNVTFRRCRAWNNGKYGFACKGSGNFRLDRCAGWGNDSSQMYARGFGGDDDTARPFTLNDFTLTNCVFIAPPDQRGGSALNWRENTDLRAYNCTVVGLRNEVYRQAGGYAFLLGNHHAIPSTAVLQNCIIAGYTNTPAMRFAASGSTPYMVNTRYEGRTNLFYAQPATKFKYQGRNMSTLGTWQAYWAAGEPNGDDGLNGPRATAADATSAYGAPGFALLDPALVPLRKLWAPDLLNPANYCDVRLALGSPALGLGENLSGLGIAELMTDYAGDARPESGPWTIGAFQVPVAP